MDEDSETTQDIPEFIHNAVKQLISFNSNISAVEAFQNDINKKNINVDMIDFANKVKDFLHTLNTTVTDINSAFLIGFDAFISKSKIKDITTNKNNSDTENVNTDLGDNLQPGNKAGSLVHENSGNDTSESERTSEVNKKLSKQKNSEISDTNSLKKSKLRKKRRKTVSASLLSENDNTDSESERNTDTNIPNTVPDENNESNDTNIHKSNINDKIVNKESKERTKEKSKTVTHSELNNNSDSEKKKSKKVAESDNEIDSSTKKIKVNEKKLGESITDSDCDLDSDSKTSKSENKTNEKHKVANDSDIEHPKKDDKLALSDSETDSTTKKLKNIEKKKKLRENTKNIDSDCDSDNKRSKSVKKTKKKNKRSKVASDSDKANSKDDTLAESDNEMSKTKKKNKKSKVASDSDTEDPKDDKLAESDNEMSKTKKKNKKSKVASDSDTEDPKDDKLAESDNEMSKTKKKNKKSKVASDSDTENPKDDKLAESDNEISKTKKKNKKSKVASDSNSKEDDELAESDNELNKTKKTNKKSKSASDSDSDNLKEDDKLAESDNEQNSISKTLKETEKKKKIDKSIHFFSDSDSDSDNRKSKSAKNTNKENKKSKSASESDTENPKKDEELAESDNEINKTKKKKKKSKSANDSDTTNPKEDDKLAESDKEINQTKKKNKKSKSASDSDTENLKKDDELAESDNEINKTKKKNKKSKSASDSDTENPKKDDELAESDNEINKTKKKNKKSKSASDSDTANPKEDDKLAESDKEINSISKTLKETEKKRKLDKSVHFFSDSDSDADNRKSKSAKNTNKENEKSKITNESDTENTKKDNVSESDSDLPEKKSNKSARKAKNRSRKERTNDSNTEKHKKDDNLSESDSDSHNKPSKRIKKKSKKSKSEIDVDQEESDNSHSKNEEMQDTVNEVNKTNSLDSDSDSYLEDPRIIIEKSKKALAEQRKSSSNFKSKNKLSNDAESLFDELKNNESVDTNQVDSNETENEKLQKDNTSVIKSVGSPKVILEKIEIGDKNSTSKNKSDKKSDTDTESTDIQNENSDNTSEPANNENDSDTNVDNKNDEEEKPKLGFLKCIDINKLLDPEVVKKTDKVPSPKKNDSIIILSSSDCESEPVVNKKRTRRGGNKQDEKTKKSKESDKKLKTSIDKSKVKVEMDEDKSDDSISERKRRSRFDRKKEKSAIAKVSFEQLRIARRRRVTLKPVVENSSSSDDDSDSSSSSTISQKKSLNRKTQKRENQSFNIDPNYDYTKDEKFKLECYVSLPKIPVEKLKEHYLQEREDAEIKRLTNMNCLKRTRQQKGATSSSDSDVKKDKKRTKLQQRKKKINNDDDEEQSEHSDKESHMSDESISNTDMNTEKKDSNPPIPEDILDSDKDISNNSSDDEDEHKKKSQNGNKKKSGKKTDEEKTKDNTEEKGKDSEKEDKEKSKWRKDPLLRGKLNMSDSEEELIRFRNKKNKIEDDIKSEHEEEIVLKKSKTKKQLKRIARRLGSDVSSSEEEKAKKSDSEKENSVESLSSDSEEEKSTKKKPQRRRIKRIKDSDDESSDGEEQAKKDKKKKKDEEDEKTRKKIRHVWSKDSLAESTKEAVKEEEERKKRIADKQKLYNQIYENKLDLNAKVDKVILDFNEETKEELLSVHPDLVAKLKPHQAKGVQFMWTACFESIERAKNTEGSGCILAHCMGLGKTLQVITLIHTLLCNSEKTNVQTVLVVCPLSTVLNWVNEFKKWLDDLDGEQVNVFDLVQHKQNYERLYQMQDWMKFGGVLVIGYDMFRNLSNPKGKRMSKKLANGFNKVLLEPGPDLVVCDEGHLLKNEKTGISIAMNRLKTKRRIVLTGTPLQNNLKEYFCMVQFVKPSLLGTYKEYLNRFVNPITNGQYTDSTPHDIQIMRRRAHVLHKMLDAVVERRDYNVLAPFLPPKHEFVLFITLTPCQIELYKEYLAKFSRNTESKGTSYLFQDFQELQRICIHPRVLLDKSNQDKLRKDLEDDDSEGSLKDFINDDESDKSTTADESSSESGSDSDKKASVSTRRTRANPGGHVEEEPEPVAKSDEWWSKFCQEDELDNINHSSKIKLLFDILHQCEMIGDKVLVFSQSLYSLNLIEYFLARIDEATQSGDTESAALVGGYTGSWALGLDYFRLDGSTSCENRATWCKSFNNEANTRSRLFLISTRAGGLGINLVAANRVIVFDVSWNPSYDIQSIYRVYRFGQTKPCYIYRFVTLGTMENKIYERQVTKQAISKRVIDEQQIDRHYNQTDLAELYAFNPIPDEERPIPLVPKDRLFADLLQSHEKYIFKYHEHNSLLEDKADEGLNEEERRAAWEEFENEKKAPKFNLMQTMVRNGMFETLRILVQEDNSGWTPAQINNILPMIVQRISEQVSKGDYSMYRRVEERHELRVLEQRRMQMIYQQYMQQLRNAPGGGPMTPTDINKLAQMINAYNQNLTQPRPQIPGSSASLATFRQGDPPPQQMLPGLLAAPIPHPAVNEVVELND